MQKRKTRGTVEGDTTPRRRRTMAWRNRVVEDLSSMRNDRDRARARRNLLGEICRRHGPRAADFVEPIMADLWGSGTSAQVAQHCREPPNVNEWVLKTANDMTEMIEEHEGAWNVPVAGPALGYTVWDFPCCACVAGRILEHKVGAATHGETGLGAGCYGEVDRAHDLVRTQSGADGSSAPPDSDARSEETRPGDEGSFMQMQMQGRPGDVPTWEHLMEQFETWFVEGGDVRLLFQMVKDAAQKRLNLRYARWVQGPVSSLRIGSLCRADVSPGTREIRGASGSVGTSCGAKTVASLYEHAHPVPEAPTEHREGDLPTSWKDNGVNCTETDLVEIPVAPRR
eukprot:s7434_g3.t1